jgi:hypothetical protein
MIQTVCPAFDGGDLPFFEPTEGLRGSQRGKARRLVKLGKVERLAPWKWAVRHIEGHSKQDHIVAWNYTGLFCDCQHYATKGTACSHMLAVSLFEKGGKGNGEAKA